MVIISCILPIVYVIAGRRWVKGKEAWDVWQQAKGSYHEDNKYSIAFV